MYKPGGHWPPHYDAHNYIDTTRKSLGVLFHYVIFNAGLLRTNKGRKALSIAI